MEQHKEVMGQWFMCHYIKKTKTTIISHKSGLEARKLTHNPVLVKLYKHVQMCALFERLS